MLRIVAILVGLIFSQIAFATKIYKASVSEVYAKSDLVLFGTIQSGRVLPDNCGVEYVVRVGVPFKGKLRSGALINFRSGGATQIGAEYFLFLSTLEREFTPLLSTNSGVMDMQAKHIERCRAKWPPFHVNVFGNGALKSTGTYNTGLPRAVLFNDSVLIPPKSLKVTELGPFDRYDNDKNSTALDAEKFMAYLKRLSSGK